MMKKSRKISLFVAFFFMVFSVMVFAAPGDLDPTFGTGGVVTYIGPGNGNDTGHAVAVQKDGKIVVVGESRNGANDDVLVLRYNNNGSLDTTFGTGGVVTYNGTGNGNDLGSDVAIQKDGKIVVAGFTCGDAQNYYILVLRYNTDGTLDSTFGTGGVVTYKTSPNVLGIYKLAIQKDGKIVVVGSDENVATSFDVLVLRYKKNGTLDTTFGTGGVVTYDDPANSWEEGTALVLQRDGKIVVAGYGYNVSSNDVLLLRYNTDGTLDDTFGTGGVVTYNGPANKDDLAIGVAIQDDGKIVVVGDSHNRANNLEVLVLRYKKNGTLDTTFGTGGVVTYDDPAKYIDWANGVSIQRGGKIVVVGFSSEVLTPNVLILRYTKNGTLDTTFGTGGVVIYNGPDHVAASAIAVSIQKDGKIVAVGDSHNGANWEALVIRLLK